MKKNDTLGNFAPVVAGLSTTWKTYRASVRRRSETPTETFFNDLFGREASDVDAAKALAQDIAEIRDTLRARKNDKKFTYTIIN